MIARLRGELAATGADSVVVDVQGVGYRASMPLSEIERLPAIGETVLLHTHTYVREDTLALFGFLEEEQRETFELLLGVSGVGPRVALALLSVLSTSDLLNAIASDEPRQLQRAPGVGLKLAQRIILELKDRVAGLPRAAGAPPAPRSVSADVLDGLLGLGYSRSEAARAVEQALKEVEDRADTGKLLRVALRILTQR